MSCQKCIDKWGQEPSPWGDSGMELDAYDEHVRDHEEKGTYENPNLRVKRSV